MVMASLAFSLDADIDPNFLLHRSDLSLLRAS